jgi:hypothetical protein
MIEVSLNSNNPKDIHLMKIHDIMYDINNNMLLKQTFDVDKVFEKFNDEYIDTVEYKYASINQKYMSDMLWLLNGILSEIHKRFDPTSMFRKWYRNVNEIAKYTISNLNKMVSIIENIKDLILNKINEIDENTPVKSDRYHETMQLIEKQQKTLIEYIGRVKSLKGLIQV